MSWSAGSTCGRRPQIRIGMVGIIGEFHFRLALLILKVQAATGHSRRRLPSYRLNSTMPAPRAAPPHRALTEVKTVVGTNHHYFHLYFQRPGIPYRHISTNPYVQPTRSHADSHGGGKLGVTMIPAAAPDFRPRFVSPNFRNTAMGRRPGFPLHAPLGY
jgi:hypothetical protein